MDHGVAAGVYRHHKGDRYLVVAIAETRKHNGDLDVVYIPLRYGKHVTCPLRQDSRGEDSWTDPVDWLDGKKRHRFVLETSLRPEEFAVLEQLWRDAEKNAERRI